MRKVIIIIGLMVSSCTTIRDTMELPYSSKEYIRNIRILCDDVSSFNPITGEVECN